ncbi:HesA/MoeB/ThiF family protein [Clostridium saccharoperbutylacetonicum]|uniref:HesA/MoeB/ThiF family protein n=1 Tax=Clostridium saccharoperbutylacetonicum TaxID=36745 RepID=UPI000983DB62|nr:ThiF family adenylyltransferase [Clostridium saccharoperbutylacetonicum]AQR93107.1 molybdopterin-synthase adenylyltransferase [Clostridium saccharoperbutylacetonicum]NSB34517.1 molybdopterin/thiamine biosynthesis adenylyltransferase [Clostridium saccharoperbutylacetonicum]
MKKSPSNEILVGRRDIEDIEGLTILEDVVWNSSINKCILKLQFDLDGIPATSELKKTVWYVHIDDNYPKGKINFYPAFNGGINITYPHQSYNGYTEGELWRSGNLCLDSQIKGLNRGINPSEYTNVEDRLYWHCLRALNWIKAAFEGDLLSIGDYFELPVFPASNRNELVAFNESDETFGRWHFSKSVYGYVELIKFKSDPNIFLIESMNTSKGHIRRKITWGSINNNLKKQTGLWILLKDIPIIIDWQVPRTYKELMELCTKQAIDIVSIIKDFAKEHRNNKRYFLIIGFPIPNKIGEPDVQICWQAIKLPAFSTDQIYFKGYSYGKAKFRLVQKNESIYWNMDLKRIFDKNMNIEWITTENWNAETLQSRGRVVRQLRELNILLIGCGALGSHIGENLARAGILKLTLMDGERLAAGNLTRHTLTLNEILKGKAEMISRRLSLCNPLIDIQSISEKLTSSNIESLNLNQYDLIIDCTGDNSILELLEEFNFKDNKIIISSSISRNAKRLYLFSSDAKVFKASSFLEKLKPFAIRDLNEFKNEPLPREGIGCWNPVFPAKANEITLMASISINYIEEVIQENPYRDNFRVYETLYNNGIFSGVNIVETEKNNAYQ